MRICAYNGVARYSEAFLGDEAMLYTHLPHLKVIRDVIFLRELAHHLALLRSLYILIRRKMVGNDSDLILIVYRLFARFRELSYRYGRRDVVAQREVDIGLDELPRVHLVKPCFRSQYFLCHCHTH